MLANTLRICEVAQPLCPTRPTGSGGCTDAPRRLTQRKLSRAVANLFARHLIVSGVGAPSIGETHLVLDQRDVLQSVLVASPASQHLFRNYSYITNSCLLVDLIALFSRAFG